VGARDEGLAFELGISCQARRCFPPEDKAAVVALIRSTGKTVGQVAKALDLPETAVGEWVKRADLDAGRRTDGLTTAARQELADCAASTEICVKSARSSARPWCSSHGRPVTGARLSADRSGASTPLGLPAGPRAGCGRCWL
jgi:transposase